MDEGVLPPTTPVNPYLGGTHEKNEPRFTCLFIYAHFANLILELNMVAGVLLEHIYEPGGPGCRRDTHSIKRVKIQTCLFSIN